MFTAAVPAGKRMRWLRILNVKVLIKSMCKYKNPAYFFCKYKNMVRFNIVMNRNQGWIYIITSFRLSIWLSV